MQKTLAVVKESLLLTLGTFLVAAGVYFFKFPNSFNTGGVTGMAIILHAIFPAVSSSAFASVINLAFLRWIRVSASAPCTARSCSPSCCPGWSGCSPCQARSPTRKCWSCFSR